MESTVVGHQDARVGDYKSALCDVSDIDMLLTSPPYNIGSKAPKRITKRRSGGYDAKSWGSIEGYPDAVPEHLYQRGQVAFLRWCAARLSPHGVVIYNHKNRHVEGRVISPLEWILKQKGLVVHDIITWWRGSTHNHAPAFVYPESELLFVLKRPSSKIVFHNQDFFWKDSRNKGCGDTWAIPREHGVAHNAPFPLVLARHCIRLWSDPGALVCDPYFGSGTTLVAAEMEGRRGVGSERLENYAGLALSRLASVCRKEAVA